MWHWLLTLVLVGAVAMVLWGDDMKEGFWWQYPCVYNAQNRMVCNPNWYPPWYWWAPLRSSRGIAGDLRGDPFPYDGYIWGNEGLWRYRWY